MSKFLKTLMKGSVFVVLVLISNVLFSQILQGTQLGQIVMMGGLFVLIAYAFGALADKD